MENLKLSAPWEIYYTKMLMLFERDKDVDVVFYDDEEKVIKVFVEKPEKADALSKLLPSVKIFGNVIVKIDVIPANVEEESPVELFRKAFEGNSALSYIKTTPPPFEFNYVVFKKEIVQFFADNMTDPNGLYSTLYQDIAQEIFDTPLGVYFSTDVAVG